MTRSSGPVAVLPSADAPDRRATRSDARATRRAAEPVRGDIQGLRALAVLIVLLFHFWPGSLTGGYVGVDVFFVISGFLISSHLMRSPPTTPRLLGRFWARRVRRLLPAASLVLGVTLVASIVWLPSTLLPTVARETIASALSVENWALAASATDYLSAENAPSPVQHYWSLSVEEQFYVLWPLLIAALAFLGRGRRPQAWWAVGLLGVTAASFTTSVLLTSSDPAAAYFVTPTRVWELGLGSILALVVHNGWRLRSPRLRSALAWLGLGMILWAAMRFDSTTPFPGTAALLPTVGGVLVIAADSDSAPWSPRGLLRARASQRLGDLSYSVYLWHWPLVVILPYALAHDLTLVEKLLAIAVVLVLAALTKRFVEDPVRRSRVLGASLPRSFAILATSVLVLGGAGIAVIQRSDAAVAAEEKILAAKLETSDCVGADATRSPACTSVSGGELLSSPEVARTDKSQVYDDGCWSNRPFTDHNVCTYGDPRGAVRLALMGNSHAGHWQPALAPIAKEHGWRLDTYLVSQCYTVDLDVDFGSASATRNCRTWNRWAVDRVGSGAYDLVVMSDRTFQQVIGVPAGNKAAVTQRAYAETLRTITAGGTPVLVLRDVPSALGSAPDCVAAHANDVSACVNPQRRAVEPDPLFAAARADTSGLVSGLDLTDRFCRDGRCHVVVGGLIAYFDHGHLTTAFARTLIPDLTPAIDSALAGSRSG
ncbi:MAG: acyltransferase family protein [Ornithinibacter sp.]